MPSQTPLGRLARYSQAHQCYNVGQGRKTGERREVVNTECFSQPSLQLSLQLNFALFCARYSGGW